MPFLANSKHLLTTWLANVRVSLIREMEFRVNFFSGLLRQTMWLLAFVFFVETIFQNTTALAGWNKSEVLIVLALSRLIEGTINTLFGRNIANFPSLVRTGTFDYLLTKPLPSQFTVAFSRFKLMETGNILAGIGLLIYALALQPQLPGFTAWLAALFFAIAGITIYYCLLMISVSLVFYLEQFEAFPAISGLLSDPLTVPFNVFPAGIQTVLTYLIPLAFVVFVPAQALTDRLHTWQLPVALLITTVFLILTNFAWRAGLRRYTSASS